MSLVWRKIPETESIRPAPVQARYLHKSGNRPARGQQRDVPLSSRHVSPAPDGAVFGNDTAQGDIVGFAGDGRNLLRGEGNTNRRSRHHR